MDQADRLVIGRMGRAPLRQNAPEQYRFHNSARVFDGLNAFWNFPYFSAAEVLNALMP